MSYLVFHPQSRFFSQINARVVSFGTYILNLRKNNNFHAKTAFETTTTMTTTTTTTVKMMRDDDDRRSASRGEAFVPEKKILHHYHHHHHHRRGFVVNTFLFLIVLLIVDVFVDSSFAAVTPIPSAKWHDFVKACLEIAPMDGMCTS